jgi:hypothetical protein
MSHKIVPALILFLYMLLVTGLSGQPRPRIVRPVNDSEVVTVPRSAHRLATPVNQTGRAEPALAMGRILLLLQRSADQEAALQQLLAAQQDPGSPQYHGWLSPEAFGQQFGPAQQDIDAVTGWLESQRFQVNQVASGRTTIEFSGSVRQVEAAFHTEIHRYRVNGVEHIANSTDIAIPAALAPVVAGVVSLNDFRGRPLDRARMFEGPEETSSSGQHAVTPYDFAAIYNLAPLWNAGFDGTGQTIAIPGRSDINLNDIATFRARFGLPAATPHVIVNGADPGRISGDEGESVVDVTWSGAAAKGAAITFVVSRDTNTTGGEVLSSSYIVNNNVASVMSLSYGICEAENSNQFWSNLWSQASAQGISVFVAAGDNGSAGCDDQTDVIQPASGGFAVNGTASTPYNVAVGGTEFNDTASPSTYWSSTNNSSTLASATGYIPEVVWNESSFTTPGAFANGLWAGSGGVSAVYGTPAWQTGNGVPTGDPGNSSQHHRYLPDVSLASADHDGYLAYLEGQLYIFSGTSVSSPAMAGIMAIVNQYTGRRNGNPNPRLYALAATAPAVFHDVTGGTNAVPCAGGSAGCSAGAPSYNIGAMTGYSAGTGYDLATGWGSVDANALVLNWGSSSGSSSVKAAMSSPTPGSVLSGSTVTFTWTAGIGASTYWLDVGTVSGQGNIFGQNVGLATNQTVSGVPASGGTIYVRLWTLLNGAWQYNDYTYSAAASSGTKAVMASPAGGSVLSGSTVTFTWTAGNGASAYWLDVGTISGQGNVFGQNVGLVTGQTVSGIPTNGATIFVRLWTLLSGAWQYNDYGYTAASGTFTTLAAMTSPAPGTALPGSATFIWSAGSGASAYWLDVGTVPGQGNIFGRNVGLVTAQTVSGIPSGVVIYVRLWTLLNGAWQYNEYTYNTGGGTCLTAGLATMQSPAPGSTLGTTATFTWTCSSSATAYWLDVGTVSGQGNIFGQNVGLSTAMSVSGIPATGGTIFVRLWTLIGGAWQHNDYTYTAP